MAYTYSRTLTVNSSQVTGTLSNFPAVICHTANEWRSVANGGHIQNTASSLPADFAVFSDSGLTTPLKFELTFWNPSTGLVVAFVKVPSIATSTVVYVGYGDAAVSTLQHDPPNVWNADYVGVWHLGNGSTLSVADSMGLNSATNNGATATAGHVDGAAAFSGSSQYIDGGSAAGITTNNLTVSCLVNPGVLTRGDLVTRWSDGAGTSQFNLIYGLTSGKPQLYVSNGLPVTSGVGSTAMSTGTWYCLHGTCSGASPSCAIYLNGVQEATGGASLTLNTTPLENYRFGDNTVGDGTFTGSMSEVRVSKVVLSDDWIEAEANSLMAPTSFWTLGAEIGGGGGDTAAQLIGGDLIDPPIIGGSLLQ